MKTILMMCLFAWASALVAQDVPAPAGAEVVLRMGGSGPRPYAAVWIEDAAGQSIRTLGVWGNKPKHQRSLKAWKAAGGGVDGISGATRPNGDYRMQWDGRDRQGAPAPAGTYVIRAESAREEGPHCQVRVTVPYGPTPVRVQSPADQDILGLFVRTPVGGAGAPP
jgi:hypothetical protein